MNDRIKKIRKMLDMTQIEFSSKIGLSRNFIAQIETGAKIPSDRTISDICRVFNVNEEWIRTGNGEIFQNDDTDDYSEITTIIGEKDPKAKKAIIDYYHLTDSDKELWWKFAERFFKGAED